MTIFQDLRNVLYVINDKLYNEMKNEETQSGNAL